VWNQKLKSLLAKVIVTIACIKKNKLEYIRVRMDGIETILFFSDKFLETKNGV
jgi:hypothetical protein